MEAKELHNVRVLGMYSSDHRVMQLQHMSVPECVIQFWPKELPTSEMITRVDYMGAQDSVSADPSFAIVTTDLLRVSVGEVVYGVEQSENR